MAADGPPDPALAHLAAAGLRVEADAADAHAHDATMPASPSARRSAAAIAGQVERIAAILGVPARAETGDGRADPRPRARRPLCRAEAARLDDRRHRQPTGSPSPTHSTRSGGRTPPPTPATAPAAATLRDRGARAEAAAAPAEAALTVAIGSGRGPLLEEIETLARQARLDLGTGATAADPTAGSAAAGRLDLTDRELEVLGLSPPVGRTRRSPTPCSSAARPPASTPRTSSTSSARGTGSRRPRIAHRLGLDAERRRHPGRRRAEG